MKDTNQRLLLTVVLCMGVAFLWSFLFPPRPTAPPEQRQPAPAQAPTQAPLPASPPAPLARPNTDVSRGTSPSTQPARPPTRKVTLQSEKLRVVLNTDGGGLESAQLLGDKFRRREGGKDQGPVDLVRSTAGIPLPLAAVVRDAAGNEGLRSDAGYEVVREDGRSAVLRASGGGVTVTKSFRIDPATYRLDLTVELHSEAAFSGQLALLSTGHGEEGSGSFFSPSSTTPARAICSAGGKIERLGAGAKHPWDGPGPAAFAGIDEQYFIRAVLSHPGANASCHLEAQAHGALIASLAVPVSLAAGASGTHAFTLYAGPKDTEELSAVAPPLRDSVDLGFWSVIASLLLGVMKFFHKVVPPHNWGVAIILLTLTVKVLTFPLQHKSMKSMQEMQRIQPQLEELKKKYAGDTQRQNLEQMKLFKEHGVNPMGSCLPLLIQMPIWLALYTTLQVSVELYNSVFIPGWLNDLTAKDPYYILPVAMGITMILTQVLTPAPMQNPSQRTMGYAMSAFFSLLMLNLPSGLTLYIFVNNILSIAQQMYLRRALRISAPPASGQTVAVTAKRA